MVPGLIRISSIWTRTILIPQPPVSAASAENPPGIERHLVDAGTGFALPRIRDGMISLMGAFNVEPFGR